MATLNSGAIDLGQLDDESMQISIPLIKLDSFVSSAENQYISIVGVERSFSLSGKKTFADAATRDAWVDSITAFIKPINSNALVYASDLMSTKTYNVFISDFKVSRAAGDTPFYITFQLELKEGKGVADA